MGLKDVLINYVQLNMEGMDKPYYLSIFRHLEIPIIIVIITSFLLLIFESELKRSLNKITNLKSFVLLLILLNVILQIIIITSTSSIPFSDSKYYVELGKNLALTGNYTNSFGNFTSFWPIGLPAIISVFFNLFTHPIISIKIFNILISSLFILVIYHFFKDKLTKVQLIILLMFFTFFPNNLFSANTILTDYPYSFLFWLVILLTFKLEERFGKYILLGILIGAASYLRPVGLIIPIIILFYYMQNSNIKSSLLRTGFVILTLIIVLSPWIYRNYNVFDEFVLLTTNGGFNFLMGNHAGSSGKINFNFEYDIENPNEPSEQREAYTNALNAIIKNPIKSIMRVPKKIIYSYIRGDSSITWSFKKTERNISPIFISTVFYFTNFLFYFLVITSILGLIFTLVVYSPESIDHLFMFITFMFLLIICLYVGNERYIVPIIPVHFYYFSKFLKQLS